MRKREGRQGAGDGDRGQKKRGMGECGGERQQRCAKRQRNDLLANSHVKVWSLQSDIRMVGPINSVAEHRSVNGLPALSLGAIAVHGKHTSCRMNTAGAGSTLMQVGGKTGIGVHRGQGIVVGCLPSIRFSKSVTRAHCGIRKSTRVWSDKKRNAGKQSDSCILRV